jgi:UDPglucose 6-dehydrogenase
VGLVTGSVFADLGNDVVCVDNDAHKVEQLTAGHVPFYEPGLQELVSRNAHDRRLSFTTDLTSAVRRSRVIFIAVGTPPKPDGQTDLSQVEAVAAAIGRAMDGYKVVVNKSTVPVGTGELVREVIARNQPSPVDFDVVSNPEFLREGSAIEDTLRPDRIVIGAPSRHVALTLVELYAPLERPMIITDVPSAEVIKYASNAFLAMKISFANAIANVCEGAGADVTDVMKAVGLDRRIGPAFLHAGLGYGGSCFPKDVDSLIHTAERLGYDFQLLRSVADINRSRAGRLVATMKRALDPIGGRTIAILGLAFKPNTDDLREAKSLEVIDLLHAAGARLRVYDPVAMEPARGLVPASVTFCDSAYAAAEGADALVLVTEWNEFKQLNLERLRCALRQPVIFDGRNLWEPERMRRLGFEYHATGRRPVPRPGPAGPGPRLQ